jgi:hypothetical protein
MEKVLFTARLDLGMIDRLRASAKARHTSFNNIISLSLDALDREQKAQNSLFERVVFLEKNLTALLDLVLTFSEKLDGKFGDLDEKFSQANINERERLKSLYQLLNTKMSQHYEAVEARFDKFGATKKEDSTHGRE